jgi:hypothetical protein
LLLLVLLAHGEPDTSFVKWPLRRLALAMANKKPNEGVKTENINHINLGRMVVWCS